MDDAIPTEMAAAEPPQAIVDETSPPENDAEAGAAAPAADGKGKKGKHNKREQKEQVPIEELYDLSKPIKRVSFNIIKWHIHMI